MKIEWTEKHETYFDLDQAVEDFHTMLKWNPDKDIDTAIHTAIEENIGKIGKSEEPIEIATKALKAAVGGVQMRMEFPKIWWEDSVWKE